tara:strand:- start:173 stop:313 length:141 start_codon:yes stop_codon:yes gene_type:complete
MFEMRRRDPRFALRGFRSVAQAAVKPTTFLAPDWRFLACGAMPSFS